MFDVRTRAQNVTIFSVRAIGCKGVNRWLILFQETICFKSLDSSYSCCTFVDGMTGISAAHCQMANRMGTIIIWKRKLRRYQVTLFVYLWCLKRLSSKGSTVAPRSLFGWRNFQGPRGGRDGCTNDFTTSSNRLIVFGWGTYEATEYRRRGGTWRRRGRGAR